VKYYKNSLLKKMKISKDSCLTRKLRNAASFMQKC